MSPIEELEARIAALEAQMRRVREDAAAARVLAGGADRDVADLTAKLDMHKALLDALRATQVEHGQKIDGLARRLGGVETRLGGVEGKLGDLESEMRGGFGKLAVGQSEILVLLNRLSTDDDR